MRYCLKEHFPAMLGRYSIWSDAKHPYSGIFYQNDYYTYGINIKTIDWCRTCRFNGETTMLWILKYGETLPQYVKQLDINV